MAARRPTVPSCRRSATEGARLPRHLLPVHPDGRAGGQRAARPLFGRRPASRPIPGAGGSPALRRRASRAPSTRPRRRRRRSRRSSARRSRPTSPIAGDRSTYTRPGRMGLPPDGPALRASLRGRRRGRRLPDRLGDARADARCASSAASYPVRQRAGRLAADVRAILGPGDQDQLRRGLDGVFRASAAGRHRATSISISTRSGRDATIDFVGIDNYMPLSDWRDGVDASRRRGADARSTISTICAATSRAARASTGIIRPQADRQRNRTERIAQTRPDHRRRLRQAVGVTAKDILELVVEPALQPAGRRRERRADRLGAGSRSRSGSPRSAARRWTRARTSRTSSSIRRARRASRRISRAASARRSHPAPLSAALLTLLRSESPGLCRGLEPGLVGLWRADDRYGARSCLDLGCAALSRLSLRLVGLGRRRQLGARPLAHGQGRRRRARFHGAADPGGLWLHPLRGGAALRLSRRVRASTASCRRARRSSRSDSLICSTPTSPAG